MALQLKLKIMKSKNTKFITQRKALRRPKQTTRTTTMKKRFLKQKESSSLTEPLLM